MKRICLLISLALFCCELYPQSRIDDFYSLMVSSNVEKRNEILTFIKTDNDVIKTVEYKRNLRLRDSSWKSYWETAGEQLDFLGAVNYGRDTVLIFQEFYGTRPYEPLTLIITDEEKMVVSYGSVKHLDDANGWPFYYDSFHPVLLNPVIEWDMVKLCDVISNYGSKPGDVSDSIWITITKIIVFDHEKIETSEIHLDGISFMGLRRTNTILR